MKIDADAIRAAWRAPAQRSDGAVGNAQRSLRRRRWMALLGAAGLIDAAVMSLYQLGVIRKLPDLPLPHFDSNAVVGSRAAYVLGTPDATLGALQLAATLALAGAGGTRQSGRSPWFGLLLGASTFAGAIAASAYLYEMIAKQKRACVYCLPAAAISFAMLPLGLAEARDDLSALRSRRR